MYQRRGKGKKRKLSLSDTEQRQTPRFQRGPSSDPLWRRVALGHRSCNLMAALVPPRLPPAEGRRRASETRLNSREERSQMLGVPLFTRKSLYLQPPGPPPRQPPTSGPHPKVIGPEGSHGPSRS